MKENKQVNPAVSSCTAEIVQKDGLAKISRSPGIAVHNYIVGGGCEDVPTSWTPLSCGKPSSCGTTITSMLPSGLIRIG